MFENKKLILYISKSKIKLIMVILSKIPKEQTISELEWTPSTLDNILSKIKKLVKGEIKILLSEDFVYETIISLPKESPITKDLVGQKAQEFIPENLKKTVWSFKEIPVRSEGKLTIQTTAIVRSLFEQIEKAIVKTGIKIDDIEPLSYALARFTKEFEKPFLFIYVEDKTFLVLAQKETVLATELLENPNTNAIDQFIAFVKDNLAIDIKDLIFCGKTQNINLSHYQNTDFKTEMQDISPAISLAGKETLQENRSVLSLQLLKIIHEETENKTEEQETSVTKKRFFHLIAAIIGFIAVIVIAGIFTKNLQDIAKNDFLPTPSEFTPTEQPTPATLSKSDYSIIVLNGSGKAGVATKAKELLENEGFNVVRIGNAENPNYEKTQIRFKDVVPNDLILLLDKSLKNVYDFSIGTNLEKKAESDILLIIGKE